MEAVKKKAGIFRPEYARMGITMRITLLCWLIALSTLLIFVMMTIPQQKRFFIENLESKARSVALSLHDVAAGAAVNEDYASVVTAGQTMLEGDSDVTFLIVMKNDGYSLIFEQGGWRVNDKIDEYWMPADRRPSGAIGKTPLTNLRIFHYAQPFDYSGIQWGWLHVGLLLKDYDRSVESMYHNTILLALGCIVFSLLVSLFYARQIVRPILRLRNVVEKIAGGDLSVRAEMSRNDELGNLAGSVNTMTESLLHRDLILNSIGFAAQEFMRSSQWKDSINQILEKMGNAAAVSRAFIFENCKDAEGCLYMSQRHEWNAQGVKQKGSEQERLSIPYNESGLSRWREMLGKNEIVSGSVSGMSGDERSFLKAHGIFSIIIIPVFVNNTWWGIIGFDDCVKERVWTDVEKESLRAGADILGATIARERVQEALIEAKATLEQRVEERTMELKKQIIAREKAMSDLDSAQSSLLEMSRAAGMAEVATAVLHNVGNVLNSVNVSCNLLMDQLKQSRVANISRVALLMTEPDCDLSDFLTEDSRGKQIPEYLTSLASALKKEHELMLREVKLLHSRIDHIKEIVSMQQSYSRISGVSESINPEKLMEDTLKLHAEAMVRHGITVIKDYESLPSINVDKNKVIQILLNLINNAKYACSENGGMEKIVTLRIRRRDHFVRMEVMDNGVGISRQNMTRIFQYGFTTRPSGHGFGLHSGALSARELGGSLSVFSDGPGKGATFILDLPISPGEII